MTRRAKQPCSPSMWKRCRMLCTAGRTTAWGWCRACCWASRKWCSTTLRCIRICSGQQHRTVLKDCPSCVICNAWTKHGSGQSQELACLGLRCFQVYLRPHDALRHRPQCPLLSQQERLHTIICCHCCGCHHYLQAYTQAVMHELSCLRTYRISCSAYNVITSFKRTDRACVVWGSSCCGSCWPCLPHCMHHLQTSAQAVTLHLGFFTCCGQMQSRSLLHQDIHCTS